GAAGPSGPTAGRPRTEPGRRSCQTGGAFGAYPRRLEGRERGVPFRDLRRRERPIDRERRVVPADAHRRRRRVRRRDQVLELGGVLQRQEAVGETGRDVQLVSPLRGELYREPPEQHRGLSPQIDDDVVDRTCDATHELRLLVRRYLQVQAAQRAATRVEGD